MGRIVIAAFRPKAGCEADLLDVIRDRLPLLRRLGLATDRVNVTMRSGDGVILDVSEWVDDAAIEAAHRHPDVLAHWKRYEELCEYVSLDSLPESAHPFSTFDAVELHG